VIVDEIQKVPALLDYVQKGIEKLKHTFILSGSSARKLKRGGANLLGGRALDFRLHPLTHNELGKDFKLDHALSYGTLPKVYQECVQKDFKMARSLLKALDRIVKL